MAGPPRSTRLVSLDVFRGATMAAMVIVNTPGDWNTVYWPLLHADWHGWTPTDLIFPFFVFIVGVSIVLSRRPPGAGIVVRRAAILYGLGLLLALYPRFDFSTVRVMGVLPRLALCYLAAALIYGALSSRDQAARVRAALALAMALAVGYWLVMRFVPAPGGAAGDLSPSGNIGAWLDRTIIGEAHLWRQSKTWDPEGLLSTIPAIATALTGVGAGVWLTGTRTKAQTVNALIAAGAISTCLGLLWSLIFPINKNLWTSSYVLFTSGLAAMALGLGHLVIDRDPPPRWTRPWVVLGTNALVLFVVSGWLVKTLLWLHLPAPDGSDATAYRSIYLHAFAPFAAPKVASLLFAIAALAAMYLLLEVLYRKRWFLRA